MRADHRVSDLWKQLTPASVFVVYIAIMFFSFLIRMSTKWCSCGKKLFTFKTDIRNIHISQNLASFFSSLKRSDRESMIRKEVLDHERMRCSQMPISNLGDLVLEPQAAHEFRLTGYPSYQVLRLPIAEDFNYIQPGKQGQRQTDFVISDFVANEYKKCALDLVNSVTQLAFLEPEYAKALKFDVQYINDNGYGRAEVEGMVDGTIYEDSDDEHVESEDLTDDEDAQDHAFEYLENQGGKGLRKQKSYRIRIN